MRAGNAPAAVSIPIAPDFALGEALADPLVVVAPDALDPALVAATIEQVNAAALAWLGSAAGTLEGRTLASAAPALAAAIATTPLVADARRTAQGAQSLLSIAQPTGGTRAIELRVSALGSRRLVHWRDVTHVRAIEDAYRDVEQQLGLALAAAEMGVFSWDMVNDRLRWDDMHYRMLGYDPHAVEPSYEGWRSRVHPDDVDAVEAAIREAEATRTDFRATYRIVRLDGTARWVQGRARHERDASGTPIRMHGVMIDVTEQREAEAALRVGEAELRAMNETLEQRVRERTAVAEERAEQLRQLALDLTATEARERRRIAQLLHDSVQQMISAAKMRAGMMRLGAGSASPPVAAAAGEVEQMLDRVLAATRTLAIELHPPVLQEVGLVAALRWLAGEFTHRHNLAVSLRVPDEEPVLSMQTRIVLFDAARELLFNVVKHAGVTTAALDLTASADARILLVVDDQGRGFEAPAPDDGPRVTFGFANLEHRVRLLRGTVTVISRRAHGTRVVVELPIDAQRDEGVPSRAQRPGDAMSFEGVAAAAPAGDGAVPRPAPTARPTATRTRRRILVADDHRLFREGVAQLLRDAGDFEVVGQADDGGQAVTLAAALRPDVCLLDVSMPTVNGVEAAMRISQLAPEVRVVALSMHERADMADAMRAAGAVAYLSKDVPADVLLGVLRALG